MHGFFRRNEPPTIKKILKKVRDNLAARFPYGQSTLHIILRKLGFKYGRRPGKSLHVMERADIALWRVAYLKDIRKYRQEQRHIVYLDETWFNCNEVPGRVWQDAVVQGNPRLAKHPSSDLTFGLQAACSRGKRLIVVNAIDRSGLVQDALLVFQSKNPVAPEDYHKDMDAYNFEKWFREKLLPNIEPHSVIVMDNAPYHSRKENSLPSNVRKEDAITRLTNMGFFTFLESCGERIDPATVTKKQILDSWKRHRSRFEYYVVDKMAKDAGHVVLRLPPYHCVFNPIELLWAYQKDIARKDGCERTASEAIATCETAFTQIPTADLGKYFDHIIAEEEKYWPTAALPTCDVNPLIIPLYDDESDSDEPGSSEM